MAILARQFIGGNDVCSDQFGNTYYCNSSWYNWGRWVLLGAVILGAFLLFFVFSCLTARRRRQQGARPYYGTGWAAAPFGHGPAQYNPNYQSQPPPQAYGSPPAYPQGGYYGQNQGYFGGQQTGTELREPANTYQAPSGPPPPKQ